jgi:trans-aconitate methyltransferase
MRYAFGDTDMAARRLKILADVYSASSEVFLLGAVTQRPRLATDLGCGPGYSTHLLANVLQSDHTTGLDNSEHFISLARQTETERVSFHLHNVTSIPFPSGSSDLIYMQISAYAHPRSEDRRI